MALPFEILVSNFETKIGAIVIDRTANAIWEIIINQTRTGATFQRLIKNLMMWLDGDSFFIFFRFHRIVYHIDGLICYLKYNINMPNDTLAAKLKTLPLSPGVYFHKDKAGQIIYVGKAAVLKNRVKQYFQNTRDMDIKTKALVAEIDDTDWVQTESEIDALFLEAEMVKRYMPRFNILLRDDKSLIYVRIDMKSERPYVSFTRNPADDGSDYFGPYYNGFAVKKALRYLRKIFPYYIRPPKEGSKLDLDDHLGLSPINMTNEEYKSNLRKLISYINGNKKLLIDDLSHDMKIAADLHDFEKAAIIRNKLYNLRELQRQIMFGDKEFLDISKDKALRDLTDLLGLTKIPVRIEGFDISHMSGTNVVASMVVFRNGVSDRGEYRKFKTRTDKNDDFYNMNETITRRLSEKNLKSWSKPDLILIDGGKGQLDAALQTRDNLGLFDIPFIGLAKREEQIVISRCSSVEGPAGRFAPDYHSITNAESGAVTFRDPETSRLSTSCHRKVSLQPATVGSHPPPVTLGYDVITINEYKLAELGGSKEITDDFILINLPNSTHIIKLLQRIRDESHRFAVSYHTVLKRAKQTSSVLDEISGIGPKTRSKLIRKFGSVKGIKSATEQELIQVIGSSKTKAILSYIQVI